MYQWYLHDILLKDSLAGYEGCKTDTLTLVNPTPGNYYFHCVVANSKLKEVTSETAHVIIK